MFCCIHFISQDLTIGLDIERESMPWMLAMWFHLWIEVFRQRCRGWRKRLWSGLVFGRPTLLSEWRVGNVFPPVPRASKCSKKGHYPDADAGSCWQEGSDGFPGDSAEWGSAYSEHPHHRLHLPFSSLQKRANQLQLISQWPNLQGKKVPILLFQTHILSQF